MNASPLVSVCIASYNHERFIAEAVSSVITQSYSDWELIVVDDASTDRSPEILQDITAQFSGQIRLVLLEKNAGPSEALNLAIREAKGEYLALLGSDDRMHVDRLKMQVDYLARHPDVSTVFTKVFGIDADGKRLDAAVQIFDKPITDVRNQLLQGNFLSAPSVMGRRDVWLEVGLHNTELRYIQDYDLWLRILDNHEIARIEDRLTEYRVHGDNLSFSKPEDVTFACHYETAICALNAIDRWPLERLYSIPEGLRGKARESALVAAKVAVGRLCLRIDHAYFRRPFLGMTQAYRYALEAVQMAPDLKIVQELVHEVYGLLGDKSRANGNGGLKLVEWQDRFNAPGGRAVGVSGEGRQAVQSASVSDNVGEQGDIGAERYSRWRSRHALQSHDVSLFEHRMRTKWSRCPSVHLVLIDVHADEKPLIDSLGSVASQLYSGWGLSVISGRPAITQEFESEPNLEWITTGCLEEGLGKLIAESSADWIGFLFAGDQLEPHYLVSILDLADARKDVEVVYSDTDSISRAGEYIDAKFKPEIDIDRLRSSDYIGNGCLLRTETVKSNIGFVSLGHYSFVYGILLKIIEDCGESAFAHDASILFHCYDENARLENLPATTGRRKDYLEQHLERCRLKSDVVEGYTPGVFYVEYQHATAPLVSIIIPTKDSLEVLGPCISTLLGKTAYRNYEVIVVDNNSSKTETLEYFDTIQRSDPRVRVVKYPKPYNYSAITNMAARLAKGDYLVLLNNDTAVIKEDWLDRMLSLGQREDVGIVGVRLLHPDTTIQHAGVVVGMTGSADHSHIGAAAGTPGYLGQNLIVRGVSAVTAACLLIEKSLYFSMGGLDEKDFAVLFNDVDLCLKVREKGLRVVYTPYAVLMHHGSFSLKKKKVNKQDDGALRRREYLTLIEKWLPVLANDPAFNRNLSLSSQKLLPEDKFLPGWDMHRHDCLRLVAFPTKDWRDGGFFLFPLLSRLQENNMLRYTCVPARGDAGTWVPKPVELERGKPDVLLFHAPVSDLQLNALEFYSVFNKLVFKVLLLDDPQCVPKRGCKKRSADGDDDEQRLGRALASCDRLLVTTAELSDAWSGVIDDIRVVPDGTHTQQQHLDTLLKALTPPELSQGGVDRGPDAGTVREAARIAAT
jgi:glycosyltransferase involved in cell wall biosynthesis